MYRFGDEDLSRAAERVWSEGRANPIHWQVRTAVGALPEVRLGGGWNMNGVSLHRLQLPPDMIEHLFHAGEETVSPGCDRQPRWGYPPDPVFAGFHAPMLARLERALPRGDVWRYEPKLDGFRGLLWRAPSGSVHLLSRNLKDLSHAFPELVAAGSDLPLDSLVDGEIVIADAEGRSNLVGLMNEEIIEIDQVEDGHVVLAIPSLRLIVMGRTIEEARAWARSAIAHRGLPTTQRSDAISTPQKPSCGA